MSLRVKICNIDWSLYAIIDKGYLKGRDVQRIAEQIIQGGAGIIQYRNKISGDEEFYRESQRIRQISSEENVPFIINDRVDIALAVDADGVHIGKDDLPLSATRRIFGDQKIIGFSVKNYSDFLEAKDADYLGIGAIYPTKTKEDCQPTDLKLIQEIRKQSQIPIIGIGGITLKNLAPIIQAGANGVAVISSLLDYVNIEKGANQFVHVVKKAKRVKL